MNRKRLFRLCYEERLGVRRRGMRKRSIGTQAPVTIPQVPNQRWSVNFLQDVLSDGRRFWVFAVVDDFSRECLALVVDGSISGARVGRELDRVVGLRGKPCMFDGLAHARRVLAAWRADYNAARPHTSLGGLTQIECANLAREAQNENVAN